MKNAAKVKNAVKVKNAAGNKRSKNVAAVSAATSSPLSLPNPNDVMEDHLEKMALRPPTPSRKKLKAKRPAEGESAQVIEILNIAVTM